MCQQHQLTLGRCFERKLSQESPLAVPQVQPRMERKGVESHWTSGRWLPSVRQATWTATK